MRLQPVAAQPLRRVTTRDIRLSSGHLIPAGVFVELAQYSVMRSEAWGWEQGDAFKPVSAHELHPMAQSRPECLDECFPVVRGATSLLGIWSSESVHMPKVMRILLWQLLR